MAIVTLRQSCQPPRFTEGFSLVELLVVLLIIGLGYSVVSINIGGNESHLLRTQAKNFANQTALIAEEAVLSNRQWGVDIFQEEADGVQRYGYRWLQQDDQGLWQVTDYRGESGEFLFAAEFEIKVYLEGAEQAIDITSKRVISEDNQQLSVDGQLPKRTEEPLLPTLWLLSNGEMSAFEMQLFFSQEPDNTITIMGDQLGRVMLETEQNDE